MNQMIGRSNFEQKFWEDVQELLTKKRYGGHNPAAAQHGIDLYKQDVSKYTKGGMIPETVYNQGEEKTAEVVNGVIQKGLPKRRPN